MHRLATRFFLSLAFVACTSSAQAALVNGINLNLVSAESSFSAAIGVTANIIGLGTQSAFSPALSITPNSGSANVDINWLNTGAFQSIDFNSQSALVPNWNFNVTIPALPVIGSLGSLSGTFSALTIDNFTAVPTPATVIAPIGISGGTWSAALGTHTETYAPFSITGTGLLSFLNTNLNLGMLGHTNPSPFSAGSVTVGPDIAGFSAVKVTIPYAYEEFLAGPYSIIPSVVDNVGVVVRVSGQLVYSGQVQSAAIPEVSSLLMLGLVTAGSAVPMIRRRLRVAA